MEAPASNSISRVIRRSLYHDDPPALQTKADMNPTLLISWWCTCFALAIILVRVCGRYIRTQKLFWEDKIMAVSVIPLMIRMAFVHVVLIWGTNNTTTDGLSATDIQHREIGSKLVLASRIFYAAFIWTAKLTVLEFLKRIVGSYWRRSYEIGLQVIRSFLVVTFVGVIIATLAECQPFDHYWQVIPDPGAQCREGMAQLLTMGTCDIITDLLLVIFPTPIVIMSAMTLKRKISLILLFALSLALVAVTAYRIPSTINRRSSQQYRSLLASLEILAAAGVSNSIVIGSFIRDRGAKKAKYRRASTTGISSLERTSTRLTTITQNQWGSDSDLASGLGMSLSPDLQSRRSSVPSISPRPVPPYRVSSMAEKMNSARQAGDTGAGDQDEVSSFSTNSTGLKGDDIDDYPPQSAEAINTPFSPQKMSFFDVGSLLKSEEEEASTQLSPNITSKPPRQGLPSPSLSPLPDQDPDSAGATAPAPTPARSPESNSSPDDNITSLSDVGGLLK